MLAERTNGQLPEKVLLEQYCLIVLMRSLGYLHQSTIQSTRQTFLRRTSPSSYILLRTTYANGNFKSDFSHMTSAGFVGIDLPHNPTYDHVDKSPQAEEIIDNEKNSLSEKLKLAPPTKVSMALSETLAGLTTGCKIKLSEPSKNGIRFRIA